MIALRPRRDRERPAEEPVGPGLALDVSLDLRTVRLDVALVVAARETVALAGPSGAGKTSTLRAVAGLLRPRAGRIVLDGRPWFDAAGRIDLPPERRSVGLVFQDHALFPHLDVRANVGFGRARPDRVEELLERFRIASLARAHPGELSGGERQRVALARALARDPDVLLLDEPLSALDPHTRAVVRGELAALLAELELPTLVVTHSFEDAAALASRVGVIADGRLRQLDPAGVLAARPVDEVVARFAGTNLLAGSARTAATGGSEVVLDDGGVVRVAEVGRGRVGVVVAPWDATLESPDARPVGVNVLAGVVEGVTPEGPRARVRVAGLVVEAPAARVAELGLAPGAAAAVAFRAEAARLVSLREEEG